jgi:hypothetical protein
MSIKRLFMQFLAKIFYYFIHFFIDFAKPMPGRHGRPLVANSVNVTTTFQALTRELAAPRTIVRNDPTHITHEEQETFTVRRLKPTQVTAEVATPRVIILPEPQIEVMPTYATQAQEVTMEVAPLRERIADFEMAEVAPTEPKKARKSVSKTPAKKVTPKKPVKAVKKLVKKSAASAKASASRSKSKPVPREAMGFGF